MKPCFDWRAPLVVTTLSAVIGTAQAQSFSSSVSSNYWTVSQDLYSPSSSWNVTDLGETVYNLEYTGNFPIVEPGTGTASATIFSASWSYSSTTEISGSNVVSATASSGSVGSSVGSVGVEEFLVFNNLDSVNSLTLDVTSLAVITPVLSAVPPDSASLKTYAGVDDVSGGPVHWQSIQGDTIGGTYWAGSSEYGYLGQTGNSQNFWYVTQVFVPAGSSWELGFYASTFNQANAVPTPTSLLTLGFGLASLAILRRRRR